MGTRRVKNTHPTLRLEGRLILVQQTTTTTLWLRKSQVLAARCEDQNRRNCAQSALKILQPQHQKLKYPQIQVELVVHPKEKHDASPTQNLQRNSGHLHSHAEYELIEETGNQFQSDRNQPHLPAVDG